MAGNDVKLARGEYLLRKLDELDAADPRFSQMMEELENIIKWSKQRQEELKEETAKTHREVESLNKKIEKKERNKEN